LEDRSPEGVAANEAMLRQTLAETRTIDAAALSASERVTHSMLIDVVEGNLAALGTRLHEWTVDPMNGPQTLFLDLPEYQTVTTPEDGRNLVARWRALGTYFDQAIGDLRRALADGRVAVDKPIDRTLDELHGLATLAPEDWKLAAAAREPLDDVRDVAIPAFWRYRDVLETEIRPAARSSTHAGLSHVPGGNDAYRALIRYHTSLDLDPAAVHRTGLEEMARIDAAFVELGGRLLGTSDLPSTLAALRDDPALRFRTADEVFEAAQRSLERAQAATPAWFGRLPKASCEVVRIP